MSAMYALAGIAGRVYQADRPRKLWTEQERARFLRALQSGVTTLWMRVEAGQPMKAEAFTGAKRSRQSEWKTGNSLTDFDM